MDAACRVLATTTTQRRQRWTKSRLDQAGRAVTAPPPTSFLLVSAVFPYLAHRWRCCCSRTWTCWVSPGCGSPAPQWCSPCGVAHGGWSDGSALLNAGCLLGLGAVRGASARGIEMTRRGRRLLTRLRKFVQDYERLYERQQLLNRPWEEDLLHWSWDGQNWQLHGHLSPPTDGRRRSTTSDGWCPYRTRHSSHLPPFRPQT